ncbi:hypothetical protein I4F81_002510 [Pyropia yezoensis]|uniref:Uncharacterized protein n=1 Tax=Pyropia yezoensis TaxID=2788 RepID=A0ACC3BQL6_PYRYE|nr:hypothetical protein I4F81_002510 [Neopyropia yezoensis]
MPALGRLACDGRLADVGRLPYNGAPTVPTRAGPPPKWRASASTAAPAAAAAVSLASRAATSDARASAWAALDNRGLATTAGRPLPLARVSGAVAAGSTRKRWWVRSSERRPDSAPRGGVPLPIVRRHGARRLVTARVRLRSAATGGGAAAAERPPREARAVAAAPAVGGRGGRRSVEVAPRGGLVRSTVVTGVVADIDAMVTEEGGWGGNERGTGAGVEMGESANGKSEGGKGDRQVLGHESAGASQQRW